MIPSLPLLLEERFGLLYHRGGEPLRPLPKTVGDLARETGKSDAEVGLLLFELKKEISTLFVADLRESDLTVTNDLLFQDHVERFKAADRVILRGDNALSGALYLRSLGVKAYCLLSGS